MLSLLFLSLFFLSRALSLFLCFFLLSLPLSLALSQLSFPPSFPPPWSSAGTATHDRDAPAPPPAAHLGQRRRPGLRSAATSASFSHLEPVPHISQPCITPPVPCGGLYSAQYPCVLDGDWRLRSDGMPNSRLQVARAVNAANAARKLEGLPGISTSDELAKALADGGFPNHKAMGGVPLVPVVSSPP